MNMTHPITDIIAEKDHAWSKEAVFALVTLFVMVILSGLGLAFKNRLKASDLWMWYRWRRRSMDEVELATLRTRTMASGWVGIEDVRRYQQATYTSVLRTRRGPRPSRASSRISGGSR
ncbi:hypothetical protein BKA58DRAFT_473831 [Alternaria rosae]|uniref:uncharacterized protein n=1 Tax=Alternaria rosae TaxID=1187941 RepID=UPI001E8D393C|nr:uncharacterized protein BKA58DRAFT_473831 [Alternaria rosae]KAH6851506.1 hypothetical protein BKA58DRAFT_473831 [Alternaria rosae]